MWCNHTVTLAIEFDNTSSRAEVEGFFWRNFNFALDLSPTTCLKQGVGEFFTALKNL